MLFIYFQKNSGKPKIPDDEVNILFELHVPGTFSFLYVVYCGFFPLLCLISSLWTLLVMQAIWLD